MRILFALMALVAASLPVSAQITNYAAPGNLQVTHELDCIGPDEIRNQYTPPDLLRAVDSCAEAQRYDDELMLFTVAGLYAVFDTKRVSDPTAHDAFQVLMMDDALSPDERAKAKPTFDAYIRAGSPEFVRKCAFVKKLGPPSYEPVYMIQHGMGAFLGAAQGTAKDFDAHVAWKTVVGSYLHCNTDDM